MDKTVEKKAELIPKGLLYLLGFLVAASLFVVFFSVLTDRPMVGLPTQSKVEGELSLNLKKMEDGSVSIFDLDNKEILNSRDGYSGFISVILTGIEYNRNKTGIDLRSSYSIGLYKYKSGRISVEDVDTEWSMNVTSFGSKNANLFVPMFDKVKGDK